MARIQIYIDGLIADLPQNEANLNLTFALKDRDGIAINSGSRSEYSFELPATKQNDLIFSRFHDVGEVTFSKQDLLPAIIIVDGLPFFEGRAQMRSVTTQQDRFYWRGLLYKVSFYGNNIDWVSDLKNKYIYEYDFGNITLGKVQNYSNYDNFYLSGDNFCTLPMKFKDWAVLGQVNTFKEFYPALFIKTIIDKIFSGLGYNLVSNFMNTDWFTQLILPIPFDYDKPIPDVNFGIEYMNVEANMTAPVGFIFGGQIIIFDNQTLFPTIGADPYNELTGVYTAPYSGYFEIDFVVVLTGITGFGTQQPAFAYIINTNPFVIILDSPTNIDMTQRANLVVFLNAGDTLKFVQGGISVGQFQATVEIIGELQITDPTTLNLKYLINKNWKALDLIKGLAHLFNLTFETNVALKTVTIEPADNYIYTFPSFNNIEQGFYNQGLNDITRKVDISVSGEIFNVNEFEKSIQLVYKEDSSDATVEDLNQRQIVPMAGAQFNFPVSRLKDGLNVIENPFFAPTLLFLDNEIKDVNTPAPVYIPFIWSSNYLENPLSSEGNYEIVPRILIFNSFVGSTANSAKFVIKNPFSATPATMVVDYIEAYMQNYNETFYQSIVFNSETVNGVYVKGLMERFYLAELIRRLYGKQVQVNIFWDILMLNNLTFRDAVQIHGDNYILNEINSFSVVNQRSTQTYLTYDAKGDGTEVNNIQNTTVLTKYIP